MNTAVSEDEDEAEPRWMALLAVLAVGGLYLALPSYLTVGPRWLPLAVVGVLLVPTIVSFRADKHHINQIFGHILVGSITVFLIASVFLLVHALPMHREPPSALLRSATALYITNILVFASWYWRLDAGGPHVRTISNSVRRSAFLFPQMLLSHDELEESQQASWKPTFIDYLFLAFNTSTALSPADTAVLARWAKVLMMIQALISLAIVALLAARAINILPTGS